MEQDDGELIRRWRAGEPAAFDALVRRWEQPVARFLARMLGMSAPLADLCQDVFVRVYQSRDRYREEGSFSAWLYRIALNLARDHARKQSRRPISLPEEVPIGAEANDRHWRQQEVREAIDLALCQLPLSLREVLVLRHYEELNFEEMARMLKTPASTLKSRFAVAVRKMQTILRTLGWDDEENNR